MALEIMTKQEAYLLAKDSKDYTKYYNGKMSYALHGKAWETYVSEAFSELNSQVTSENIFKSVIDLYAENLVPVDEKLRGFSNVLVPLLTRGECPVVVDSGGTPHFPEHFDMISDGKYTLAVMYTRNLETLKDYVTFVNSAGVSRVFSKDVPDDFGPADKMGYQFQAEETGHKLFRFALDDKGFGGTLAALQDRVNHSVIDQTVVAEMYARPFWYLLNVELPPTNPYLPQTSQAVEDVLKEHEGTDSAARIFTTSGQGPFGQLTPPTIGDMIAYHDSIIDKVSQSTGIPQHYFKPGQGTPPTGVALKVLTKRFNTKVSRMRDDLRPVLEELAAELNLEKTGTEKDANGNDIKVYELWNTSDDLLQEALDAHGISLSQMGYPLEYIAEVVTPGVDLDDYEEEGATPILGSAEPDMTAMGQTGLPATPGQVASYASNPGQRQKVNN